MACIISICWGAVSEPTSGTRATGLIVSLLKTMIKTLAINLYSILNSSSGVTVSLSNFRGFLFQKEYTCASAVSFRLFIMPNELHTQFEISTSDLVHNYVCQFSGPNAKKSSSSSSDLCHVLTVTVTF